MNMKKFLTKSAMDRYILQRRHWMPYVKPYRTHPASTIATPAYRKCASSSTSQSSSTGTDTPFTTAPNSAITL